jgi:DNA-binding transcriptional MocR family regulator
MMLHDIGGGNPDGRLLPDVKAVLSQSAWLPRGYEDPPDNPALIDFARQQLADDGIPVGDVWIANGTFDAVEMILRAYLQPGDTIAVEDPCFMTTLGLLKELGFPPVPMAVDDQGVLPEAMEDALNKGVKAMILTPRAHNPFGGSWTPKRRDDLAHVIGRHKDLLVIEDDHFAPLSPFKPATLVSGDRPNWAIVRSVSKYVGPDLRLAFVNSSDGLAKKVSGLAAFSYRWVSGVLQAAVLSTVTCKDYTRIIRDASEAYTARRQYLLSALKDAGIKAHGADGINVWIPVTDEQAVTRRLMEAGWIVRPGDIFRLESEQAIRVTVSTLTEQEARELAALIANLQRQGAVQRGA